MTSGQGDLRILLLGKTGAEKSATGNTILGRNAFRETSEICEKQEGDVDGKNIAVIDTPGLFNTSMTKEQVKAEIERCVEMSAPGPHVFLLVIKLGVRFTQEERNSVQWIQENFGEEALLRTIILFTHNDHLKGLSLEEYISKSHYLPKIVDSCGGRYHSFNNEDRNNHQQVTKLLQKMNALRREHGVKHYTPEMFKRAQTQMTGKDGIKLLSLTNVLSIIILMGVIFLGTQQWKNGIQLIEQDIKRLENELRENEQREQRLKTDIQQKEQEEDQLRNELLLKEREIQLNNELLQKAEKEQDLKHELQEKEREEQQLNKELQEKEQEEKQLRNQLLQKADKEQDLKHELLKQEKQQLKEKLLQKEQEMLKLKEKLLQKEQEKSQFLQQKKQEKRQLKEELLQKEKEDWQLNENLLQKEQEKEKLKKDLQQEEQENQHLKKKLLQYNQKVQ